MPDERITILVTELKKYAKKKSVWWILGTAIFISILIVALFSFFHKDELKEDLKPVIEKQKELELENKILREEIRKDSIRDDSTFRVIQRNRQVNEKKIIIFRENTRKNVEKINQPDITNDELRKLLAK